MKNKIFISILIFCLSGLNLFAVEDRSGNFECIPIFGLEWKVNIKNEHTLEECFETLKDVVYLLESSYVAFDEMEEKGFDKTAFINNSEVLFKNETKIRTIKIYDYICSQLKPYINDSHFSIMMDGISNNFDISKYIYLSDTFVEKTESGYKVKKSLKIPAGTVLSLPDENVFKTIDEGKVVYRVGVLAAGKIEELKDFPVYIDDKKTVLQCIYYPKNFISNDFSLIESKKSIYIRIPAFDIGADYIQQILDSGGKCKDKKNIIIDLRLNGGGFSDCVLEFLYDLYSGKDDPASFDEFMNIIQSKNIEAESPLISQQGQLQIDYVEQATKEIDYNYKSKTENYNTYKGNIIFLTSKVTASASEIMISRAKKLFDNVITVGVNTRGCVAYGNPYIYRLKNSGIVMTVSQLKMSDYGIIEGIGVMPDYVVSGSVEDSIRYLTKDKKIAEEIR